MRVQVSALPLFMFAVAASAQETTGEVRGLVRASSGPTVNSAQVTATSSVLLGTRRATTASDGVYHLVALPPGLYAVRVQLIGYRPVVIDSVWVRLGTTTQAPEVRLEQAAVALEAARVVAPRVALDPTRATVGATLEASEYASLPADRDYKSLMAILPHANTSYHGDAVNVGGSTGSENLNFIDGVNVTSPLNASSATRLPYNFVRSVEVRSGGYEAQYGKALGAIVNAITYSGSNDLEWNAFVFGTHDALRWSPLAQPTLRETSAYSFDVGTRLSGPAVRDRLWYSLAYNSLVERTDRDVLGFGVQPDETRSDVFAGKATWQAAPGTTIELSVFGDPTVRQSVTPPPYAPTFTPTNPDPFLTRRETGGTSTALRGMTTRGTMQFEGVLARTAGRQSSVPRTARGRDDIFYLDNVTRKIGGGVPNVGRVSQSVTTGSVRGTLSAGMHRVVVGAEYEVSEINRTLRVDLIRRNPARFVVQHETQDGSFENRIPTLYVQDSWRLHEFLTLNGGVRWSRQSLIGASGRLAQRLADEWQPRGGFSLQLDQTARRRAFGSLGRFYQQEPLNLPSLYYVPYVIKEWYYATDPRLPGATAADSIDISSRESDFAHSADGSHAEHFDEITLGYEQVVAGVARLALRGMYRTLRSTFQQGADASCPLYYCLGTPGKGALSFLPPPRRDYRALEASLEGAWRRIQYRGSYVLSSTWGNYPGLFGSDIYFANPGVVNGLMKAYQAANSTGRLPNDRPHVFKLVASSQLLKSMTIGAFFTWQSGTPISEFGVGPDERQQTPAFVTPRGSAGRLPSVRDLNVRVAAGLPGARMVTGRLVIDVLHVGNHQQATRVDQQHYLGFDAGIQTDPNPNYLRPIAFAPPMVVRIGIEASAR